MLQSIRERSDNISLADALLFSVVIIPAALGWLIGLFVRSLTLIWAAIVEGYVRGRGNVIIE